MSKAPATRERPYGEHRSWAADFTFRRHWRQRPGGAFLPQLRHVCHSFGMNGAMFSPQLTAFAERYRCITWDQRGHGQSPASGPFTLWDSARDALALLDRLERKLRGFPSLSG